MAVTADGDLDDCAAMATALITSNRIPNFVVATTTHGNGFETMGGTGGSTWRLHVGFEGLAGVVREQARQVGEQLEKSGLRNVGLADYDVYTGPFHQEWAHLGRQAFLLRADMPQTRMADFLQSASGALLANPMLLDWTCGRVLGGLAQVREANWTQWCRQAGKLGGHVLLEKAPLEFKGDHDVFGPQRSAWQVMHRVKNELDPRRIFAPGRLPGGV
jgi:FAD/FMN-containing dehydrogenase